MKELAERKLQHLEDLHVGQLMSVDVFPCNNDFTSSSIDLDAICIFDAVQIYLRGSFTRFSSTDLQPFRAEYCFFPSDQSFKSNTSAIRQDHVNEIRLELRGRHIIVLFSICEFKSLDDILNLLVMIVNYAAI